jgi:hypothetical protein
VADHADEALAVVHEHRFPVEVEVAHFADHPVGRGADRRAGGHGHVEAGVGRTRLAVEDPAQAEAARQASAGRQAQVGTRHRHVAELAADGDLALAFGVDAGQILLVRIDHLRILDAQLLHRVGLGGYRKGQRMAVAVGPDVELLLADGGVEGQADQREPAALALLEQHRLAAIADFRAGGIGCGDGDFGDAAGHGFGPQLGVGEGRGEGQKKDGMHAPAN